MPIHDWTRVIHGVFHHFQQAWIFALSKSLNAGRLPSGYYALAEQVAGGLGPDVLTLESGSIGPKRFNGNGPGGLGNSSRGVVVSTAPPKVRFTSSAEADVYARKRNRVVIRHTSGHRVIAMIEIVSAGNKSSQQALAAFVNKAVEMINEGIHLLVLDLWPPGTRDPQGIHGAIWSEFDATPFELPADKPLTLAAYSAGALKCAYVEPVAVGDVLQDMPLFLEADVYIPVPLEETYQSAWEAVPEFWRNQWIP